MANFQLLSAIDEITIPELAAPNKRRQHKVVIPIVFCDRVPTNALNLS
jgi:hypothetical protein